MTLITNTNVKHSHLFNYTLVVAFKAYKGNAREGEGDG